MDTLYIVMPAYNEEDNIEAVVCQWMSVLGGGKSSESRMVIADSGSTDRTHEILVGLQKKYPQLLILSDTGRQHGSKLISLYDYSIKQKADYIFQTDSDGQTSPEEFSAFWEMREEYGAILGNRVIREDGKFRALVESIICLLLRIYFGVKVPDANAPFRLMNTDLVTKYLYRLPIDYNIPNIMLTAYFSYYKEKIIFREISFKNRIGGKNSMNISKIIKIGWKAVGDFKKLKKMM